MPKSIYKVIIEVIKVEGKCAVEYKPGDVLIIEGFYIEPKENKSKTCIHAFITICAWSFSETYWHR